MFRPGFFINPDNAIDEVIVRSNCRKRDRIKTSHNPKDIVEFYFMDPLIK